MEYQGRKARRSRKPRAWASHLSRRSRPINDHNFTPNRVLGGNTEPPDKQEFDLIHSETINITSAAKNQDSLLSRNATITTFQEHGLNANQLKTLQAFARQGKKDWGGGPLDLETGKQSAGVGIVALEGLAPYPVTEAAEDYNDAFASGRCAIYNIDCQGATITIAVIYGWTGAKVGSINASRTDDLLAICLAQLSAMPDGPKLIAGDLNGTTACFPTLTIMTTEQGWTDVGLDPHICNGITAQNSCHANADAKESRIDYIFANQWIYPALEACQVDHCDIFPTHRPLQVAIRTTKLKHLTRRLQTPTNFAKLIETKIDKLIEEAKDKETTTQATIDNHNAPPETRTVMPTGPNPFAEDSDQHDEDNNHNHAPKGTSSKVDENLIRSTTVQQLHTIMDQQTHRREWRLKEAVLRKDTGWQWGLITASVEEANIQFHDLKRKDATKMKGRSKVTFQTGKRNLLRGAEENATIEEIFYLASIRKRFTENNLQANRLTNIVRRLKATTKNRDNPDTRRANYLHNADTMAAYHKTTTDAQNTTTNQQPQRGGEHPLPVPISIGTLNVTNGRGGEHQLPVPPATNTPNNTHTELQQHREEMQGTFDEISHIKIDNIMHAATIQRAADTHAKRAKCQLQRLKAEAARIKSSRHSNPKQRAQPLIQVHR